MAYKVRSLTIRRQEVLQEPPVPEFQSRWPALFDVSEINLEFMRLTTIPLTSKFLGELDRQTDNLMKVFNSKGGAAGRKMAAIMAQMDNNEDINVRRDCVLSCLSIYLNEDLDTLVKEHVEVNPLGREDEVGWVLAPICPHDARDDISHLNNKDTCCGLSAYELQRLENIIQKEAFLSSLKICEASEDLRQPVKPKSEVKRSKASLGKEQCPRKSFCLNEAQNLTLSRESTHKHDIDSREAEADITEKTMGIYTVRAEGHGPDGPGDGRFADVGVVLEGVEVLHSLQSVSHACVMLYGLIYALNLSYPKT